MKKEDSFKMEIKRIKDMVDDIVTQLNDVSAELIDLKDEYKAFIEKDAS